MLCCGGALPGWLNNATATPALPACRARLNAGALPLLAGCRVNVYKDKIKNADRLPQLPQQAALQEALAGTYAELR